jgi:CRP/FNR family transcriptional regulator
MATDVRAFRASAVFAGLPTRELEALAAVTREKSYAPRDIVFSEGEPADWFCVVRAGRVKIVRTSRDGKDVVLDVLGPGEPCGGVAVVEHRRYPASAQAIEPSVVLKIPAAPIVALTERHPSVIREMALMMGRRLRAAHDSVQSLAVDPVEARVARMLLRLAERDGARGPRGITLPFHLTRQTLADMTGTTVETTIRIVSRWLKNGIVRDDGAHLVLVDLAALGDLAAGSSD